MLVRKGILVWAGLLVLLAAFFGGTMWFNMAGGARVGEPLPDLGLTTLAGSPVDLDAWRGQGVMLRFSSFNCSYCSDDFALLATWQKRMGDAVKVIAVQVGDTPATVRSGLLGKTPDVPILLDGAGRVAEVLGTKSLPTIAFLTQRGTLSAVVTSEVAEADVASHVRTLLAGNPGLDDAVKRVSKQLRCQECEGRSVWESDARSSLDMRERVRQMLLAGRREDEVVDAFRAEYGDWILTSPPASGFSSLAWLLPLGGLGFGSFLWMRLMRRTRRQGRRRAEPTGDDRTDPELKEKLSRRVSDYM